MTRLATLADGGRIAVALVEAEIARLRWLWKHEGTGASVAADDEVDLEALLGEEKFAALDLFDRLQLEAVVRVCRQSRSLSDAGRRLFQATREQRSVVNDADRLRKYLAKFKLEWSQTMNAQETT
ncbi:hypothetical protein D3C71_1397800 [compost metagenome]